MEAKLLVDGSARVGTVQGDNTNAAPARFGQAALDQSMGEAALAELRFDVDIQQITAPVAFRMEWMRRPIDDEQAG